jgi:hypothetical protein
MQLSNVERASGSQIAPPVSEWTSAIDRQAATSFVAMVLVLEVELQAQRSALAAVAMRILRFMECLLLNVCHIKTAPGERTFRS